VSLLTELDAFFADHRLCGKASMGLSSGSTASAVRGSPAVLKKATHLT
jgi:hypothetical protein